MFVVLLAILMSSAATVLVYYSWRQGEVGWIAASGWLLAFGSTLPWSRALGAEIGVTYAIMVFVCLVWVKVAFNMQPARADDLAKERPLQTLHWPRAQDCFKHGSLFLLSVPVAGVLSLMLTAALVLPLAWTMPVKVAVVIFLYPVLWGAFSAWICAQDKLLKPTLASAGLLAVSSLILFT